MTVQLSHTLVFSGQRYPLWSDPLEQVLSKTKPKPDFSCCTAMFRGYVAHWEIANGRLYLHSIQGRLRHREPASAQDSRNEIVINELFSNQRPPIFAKWYSGVLVVPYGNRSKLEYSMYGCSYEQHTEIAMRRGVCRRVLDGCGVVPDSHPPSLETLKRRVVCAWAICSPLGTGQIN